MVAYKKEEQQKKPQGINPVLAGGIAAGFLSEADLASLPFSFGSSSIPSFGLEAAHPAAEIPSSFIMEGVPEFSTEFLSSAPSAGAPLAEGGLNAALEGNIIGPIAGAYGAYNLLSQDDVSAGRGALQGAASGAAMGSYFGLPGAGIGAVIGGAGGLIKGLTGSKKSEVQKHRDKMRESLKQLGFLDNNYSVSLPGGGAFDFGKDGGARIEWGKERQYQDIDWDNKTSGQVVGYVNPLVDIITGGDPKAKERIVGYFVNAAQSSDPSDLIKARANSRSFYERMGLDEGKAIEAVNTMVQSGKLAPEIADAYKFGIKQVFGSAPLDVTGSFATSAASSGRGGRVEDEEPATPNKRRRKKKKSFDISPPLTTTPIPTGPKVLSPEEYGQIMARIIKANQEPYGVSYA